MFLMAGVMQVHKHEQKQTMFAKADSNSPVAVL